MPGIKLYAILESKTIGQPNHLRKLAENLKILTKTLWIHGFDVIEDLGVTPEVQVLVLNNITLRGGLLSPAMALSLIFLECIWC